MAACPHLRVASMQQQQLAAVGRQASAVCSRSSARYEGDNVPLRFKHWGQQRQRCVSEVVRLLACVLMIVALQLAAIAYRGVATARYGGKFDGDCRMVTLPFVLLFCVLFMLVADAAEQLTNFPALLPILEKKQLLHVRHTRRAPAMLML